MVIMGIGTIPETLSRAAALQQPLNAFSFSFRDAHVSITHTAMWLLLNQMLLLYIVLYFLYKFYFSGDPTQFQNSFSVQHDTKMSSKLNFYQDL